MGNWDKMVEDWDKLASDYLGIEETYYSFSEGGYHFIVLDSAVLGEVGGTLDDEQLY